MRPKRSPKPGFFSPKIAPQGWPPFGQGLPYFYGVNSVLGYLGEILGSNLKKLHKSDINFQESRL
ncbi:hypothetical protein NIES39_C05130 [Arthrospira platensis NIES-39]|nr:hypothetical protein NIES39_C05130 [Arthrospira platensis NIES-39]